MGVREPLHVGEGDGRRRQALVARNYALAWAFTDYLLAERRALFDRCLAAAREGRGTERIWRSILEPELTDELRVAFSDHARGLALP